MGVVYRAYDTTLDREIALKELLGPASATPELREELVERFQREARAAARLSHPNVVQVFDVAVQDGRYFIAMELLEGMPLTTVIEGGISQQSATHLLIQMLDAVQTAHDAGVVHRDLKPDNIFVLDDGRVKVTDFGIAKMAETGSSTMTQIGTVMGTPGYMAPEQVMGLPVDGRADIFSLGVIGYELFNGANPFVGPSTTTTLYRIVNEHPVPLDTHHASAQVCAVIGKAIAKAPEARYQTAAAMAHDLRTGAAPDSESALVENAIPGGEVDRSKTTTWMAVGGVAAVAVLGLLVFTGLPGRGASSGVNVTTIAPLVVAAPTVAGEAVAGEELEVVLELPTSSGVGSADLVVDGVPLGESRTAAPYAWSWTPSDAGDYSLAVRVATTGGQQVDGAAANVVISEPATVVTPDAADASGLGSEGFWTAVFANEKSESAAQGKAREVTDQGHEADTLFSSEWENLKPGWYVAFSGSFSSESEAQARVLELKSSGYSAYARFTGPYSGGY